MSHEISPALVGKRIRLIFIIKRMDQTDRTFIDDMTKMIIRPHRDIYTLEKMGKCPTTQALRR